jgi:hypothetical protein
MNKSEEIAAFHAFRCNMPPASYLRPWLDSIADEIESSLTSDYFPCASIRDAQKQAAAIVSDARAHAAELIRTAKEQAAKDTAAAAKTINDTMSRALSAVAAAERALCNY